MSDLQWRRMKPDVPGLWVRQSPEGLVEIRYITADDIERGGFRPGLWAGPLKIRDPDPELRLPGGCEVFDKALPNRKKHRTRVTLPSGCEADIVADHRATAIRAAQAAVDVLTGGE